MINLDTLKEQKEDILASLSVAIKMAMIKQWKMLWISTAT